MPTLIGTSDSLLFFSEGPWGVVVDSDINVVVASGSASVLSASRDWSPASDVDTEHAESLAVLTLSTLVASAAGTSSKYTIPKGVQEEAKKALEWRKEEGRGGTSVGLNTARTLAKGGQIGIQKVRHIAKYFPRHEVDKKGKGWSPGEDGFPSNGRIAWALWGGDAAKRWASDIVEREEKRALRADGYSLVEYPVEPFQLTDFDDPQDIDNEYAPEFLARVHLDGSGMDRLYKVDGDKRCYVWDDGHWDDLGLEYPTIWDYDDALDGDTVAPVSHIEIDPDSAVVIAAKLYSNPNKYVTVEDIDEEEAYLAADAIEEIDWELLDRSMVAAAVNPEDGVYTPEERAQNATKQVRDATGKFAKSGSRVMVGGDQNRQGEITKLNPERGTVSVRMDSGEEIEVGGKAVQPAPAAPAAAPAPGIIGEKKILDTSGILGEPRTPVNRAIAQLPGTMPALTAESLQGVLADWPAWVKKQRDEFVPGESQKRTAVQGRDSVNTGPMGEKLRNETGKSLILDAYKHPLLNKWLNRQDERGYTPNKLWYQPIVSSGEKEVLVTPETSDVQPAYMAVVDPDDPRAVLGLVSLVPASSVSNAPMTYTRKDGKWVRDPKTLADLNSPTPPPVVPLDGDDLNDVLKQVDETQGVTASLVLSVLFGPNVEAVVAAGGLDRNRGGAEKLRTYWTKGTGATKIRWGTPGDWKRCVRFLSKHMGVRSKGYCQLRHKEATGIYTGNRNNPGNFSTEVTVEDMQTSLAAILAEQDELATEDFQIDEEIELLMSDQEALDWEEYALIAAGGLDQNRGNAEKLRRYWTRGKGAAKIRWGAPGDWTRCVRNLKKYLGPRAKGYCALRHKEMNGMWPGDRRNRTNFGIFDDTVLATEEQIITASALQAQKEVLSSIVAALKSGEDRNVAVENFFIKEPVVRTSEMEDIVEETEPVDEQDIKIDDLTPSQETVNMKRVESVEESEKPVSVLITEEDGPVLVDGHHRTAAYRIRGEDDIPAEIYRALAASAGVEYYDGGYDLEDLSDDDIALLATAGSKPAPKKDQIKGSEKNKKGSADTGAGVTFTQKIEDALAKKVQEHNKNAKDGRKTSIKTLKAVYRRGAGAFSTSHRPDQNRNSWAMARVNAYLHLLKTGTPKNKKYTTDNDLLPASHPRSSKSENAVVAGAYKTDGARFVIPLVIPEQMDSGDGRRFKEGAIELRELPLPLLWQIKTGNGHDGSVVVGRIDYMERTEDGIGNAYGYFDTGKYGREAERLVRGQFLRGVSADMDKFEATEEPDETVGEASDDEDKTIKKDKIVINKARVMAVTIVPKPAFQECKIMLDEGYNTLDQENEMIPDGIYVEDVDPSDAEAIVASGLIAGAIPVAPPKDWFGNPKLSQPTPITVDDQGRIYGHIAAWNVDHIGMSFGTKPPRSRSNYAYFHTGVVRTEEGDDVAVGQLTLAGGHADIRATAEMAVKHYDDTASAVADVHAGEDQFGIWVAGALRPGVTPEQVRTLRASAPSGDWRPIRGALELVAVCQVNVPGFPVARAMVASGQVMALVAAGASAMARLRGNPVEELATRISRLEQKEHSEALLAAAEEAKAKFSALKPVEYFADMSDDEREKLAKKGQALPDGSYPIRNEEDLKNAIQAFGRAKESKRAEVKRHIVKRARALGKSELIPENWNFSLTPEQLRARTAEFSTKLEK